MKTYANKHACMDVDMSACDRSFIRMSVKIEYLALKQNRSEVLLLSR